MLLSDRDKDRKRRALVTTVPYGEVERTPLRLLEEHGIEAVLNPLGRRLREDELVDIIGDFEALIAGTEVIGPAAIRAARNLRIIARVGIGLDNVSLAFARAHGIQVVYTPDAPAPAVAEFTIGQMLALLRKMPAADRGMRKGLWRRRIGRSLAECTVGVVGVGRIGSRVIRHLSAFRPQAILAYDPVVHPTLMDECRCTWTDLVTIFREADIITLHVPLNRTTRSLVGASELGNLKEGAILINTSRGGVVDEEALADVLESRPDLSAAVDVFLEEPYQGKLALLENTLLTCHMGSCAEDCRLRMESEAAWEVIRYFEGHPLRNPVPEEEYAASFQPEAITVPEPALDSAEHFP